MPPRFFKKLKCLMNIYRKANKKRYSRRGNIIRKIIKHARKNFRFGIDKPQSLCYNIIDNRDNYYSRVS